MKEILIKKLEELNKQKEKHRNNFIQLSSALEKCKTTLDGTNGAIEVVEALLIEANKDKK